MGLDDVEKVILPKETRYVTFNFDLTQIHKIEKEDLLILRERLIKKQGQLELMIAEVNRFITMRGQAERLEKKRPKYKRIGEK